MLSGLLHDEALDVNTAAPSLNRRNSPCHKRAPPKLLNPPSKVSISRVMRIVPRLMIFPIRWIAQRNAKRVVTFDFRRLDENVFN